MATCFDIMDISKTKYEDIFGSSDSGITVNALHAALGAWSDISSFPEACAGGGLWVLGICMVGEESNLDFDGLENENSESEKGESDSESDQEDEVMLEWMNDLNHITVDDFTSPTGITFELGNDA
ncbi:hypothetical protein ACROYT_G013826 [Oculina patagonica]